MANQIYSFQNKTDSIPNASVYSMESQAGAPLKTCLLGTKMSHFLFSLSSLSDMQPWPPSSRNHWKKLSTVPPFCAGLHVSLPPTLDGSLTLVTILPHTTLAQENMPYIFNTLVRFLSLQFNSFDSRWHLDKVFNPYHYKRHFLWAPRPSNVDLLLNLTLRMVFFAWYTAEPFLGRLDQHATPIHFR